MSKTKTRRDIKKYVLAVMKPNYCVYVKHSRGFEHKGMLKDLITVWVWRKGQNRVLEGSCYESVVDDAFRIALDIIGHEFD